MPGRSSDFEAGGRRQSIAAAGVSDMKMDDGFSAQGDGLWSRHDDPRLWDDVRLGDRRSDRSVRPPGPSRNLVPWLRGALLAVGLFDDAADVSRGAPVPLQRRRLLLSHPMGLEISPLGQCDDRLVLEGHLGSVLPAARLGIGIAAAVAVDFNSAVFVRKTSDADGRNRAASVGPHARHGGTLRGSGSKNRGVKGTPNESLHLSRRHILAFDPTLSLPPRR